MKEVRIIKPEKKITEYNSIEEMAEGETFIGVLHNNTDRYILAVDDNSKVLGAVSAFGVLSLHIVENSENIRFFSFLLSDDLYKWLLGRPLHEK